MQSPPFKTYLCRYNFGGCEWAFEISAESPEDARARLSRLAYAKLDGELIASVPYVLGPLARLAAGVRNLFVGRPR